MAKAQNIGRHQFSTQDRLFFDTNIWMYIFDCRNDPRIEKSEQLTKIYSGALARMLKNGSQIYTHAVVISEYLNRLLHDEHRFMVKIGSAGREYKAWRGSQSYGAFASAVTAQTRSILARCEVLEDGFHKDLLLHHLQTLEEDAIDFSDQLILHLCQKHDLTLVTHDHDFAQSELRILTANSTLF